MFKILLVLVVSLMSSISSYAADDGYRILWICESQYPETLDKPDPVKLMMKDEKYYLSFFRGTEESIVHMIPVTNEEFMGQLEEDLAFFEYLPDGHFLIAIKERVVRLNCYLY